MNRDPLTSTLYYFEPSNFEDLMFSFTATRRGTTNKPDFDYTNVGLLFPQNDASETISMIGQIPHSVQKNSMIYPHVHWQQSQAAFPTWKLAYKLVENGQAVGTFKTLASNTGVFSYVSGNLAQISEFSPIMLPASLSAVLLMIFYREDNTVTGDVLAWQFDIHVQKDSVGSGLEYTK
jgi:hypothetical protein